MKSNKLVLLGAILILSSGCHRDSDNSSGGSSGPQAIVAGLPNGGSLPVISGNNVLPMTVNGSTCSNGSYPNKPCVTVTVCAPGTTNCQTIGDILVDTGSFGLRIFRSRISVPLTPVTVSGKTVGECVQFADGSAQWGQVETAGVILGGEAQVQVPVHVIDSAFAGVPASCGTPVTSPSDAGFNGILGVGLLAQDCGQGCTSVSNNGFYFSCTGSACSGTALPLASQVTNPVARLAHDNNGVVLELPSIPLGGVPSLNGYLVLGIGTQANNTPQAVTVLTADPDFGVFSTNLNGQVSDGFLDSGSNGLYFDAPSSAGLPDCSFFNQGMAGWFCPNGTASLSAVNTGSNGATASSVNFLVGNAINLDNNPGKNVFIELAGSSGGDFDWGLPFYIGRNVYIGLEGAASSLGTGPYYAY